MKLKLGSKLLVVIAAACGVSFAVDASTIWDEASNGDLSNNGLSPTSLVMALGSNIVLGTTGNDGQGIDRDYFSFIVPVGATVSSIMLLGSTNVSGGASFIGIQAGSQLTVTPSGGGAENLLGFAHYGNDQVGTDILPSVLIGSATALSSGVYSVWVQETGGPATYGFDFAVTPVPLPGAAVLLLSGLLGIGSLNRLTSRSKREVL